jgi:uncharacterized protein (TIGR02246 family)
VYRLYILNQMPVYLCYKKKGVTPMSKIILSIAFLIATSTLALGQADKEQGVRQTLDKMQAALRNNDANSYVSSFADDYTFISPRGVLMNKSERLESMTTGQSKFESFNYENVKIRFYGNTAVVNAKANVKNVGTDATTAMVTLVLVKKASQWQVVAHQATPPAQ